MSSNKSSAGRAGARRKASAETAAGRLGLLALLILALAIPALLVGVARVSAQRPTTVKIKPQAPVTTRVPAKPTAPVQTIAPVQASAPVQTTTADAPPVATSKRIQSVRTTRVNFKQLSDAAKRVRVPLTTTQTLRIIPAPMSIQESPAGGDAATEGGEGGDTLAVPGPALQSDTGGPNAPSPSPSQSYLAQEDGPKTGTTSFTIPPDTMGAVGIDKVFVNLNNNYRVQDKTTGSPLSTVSPDTFWASTGATGVFDPRVQFDPYQQRWLLSAVSNGSSASSSVLVGISDTSDPQGTYTLFRIVVGCAPGAAGCNSAGEWADFPMLGFNKNWIAIGWNQFTINTNAFVAGKMLVLDYPTARTGTANGTIFSNPSAATGFCMHPVTTFSPTEATLYVPTHQQSSGALYRLHTITGTPSAPVFNVDATANTRPGGGWTQPGGDNLPQQCVPGVSIATQTCPATPRGLEASDAFIRSNAVFRNGLIYYPQAIALPAGATNGSATIRYAVQWTALNPDGSFNTGGRVEDPTATLTNGGKHYSYPSLSVNKNNDILLGFSEFESDDYVDAGYTFRLGTDAAGTMRDPVIYKEGEDYYQKTFSGTRNRWGDYSHTVVDPINDRDIWTIQEYAQARVGTTGQASNDSRWGTWWAKVSVPAGAGDLLISEFRLRGPGGANDEFIEIYNASGAALTVETLDGSAGYSVAASDGVRCTIPSGTIIPERGHYLCVNPVGYSLASYPAGNGTTATGDETYTTDIPDNAGLAIFSTATAANFSLETRLDAVGSTAEASTLYKEGAGYPALGGTAYLSGIDYALHRDLCGKGGSITTLGACPTGGNPKDTNDNAADFVFVDTNGTSAGAGQRLGAPGPENLSSPIQRNFSFPGGNLDPAVGSSSPPNRVRDFTSDPVNNSTFGTLLIRKTLTNNSGASVTRLRFRVIDQTTFPAPSGFADLRTRTSSTQVVSITGTNPACPANNCTVQGTVMEEPPAQPNGGAFNTTLSVGTVTLAAPIAPGGTINVQFLLGIQQTGTFKFFVNVEALP